MAGFSSPRILRLIDCRDPQLVGGKAAGIGQLLRANFRVPDGCCLTTVCYEHALYTAGGNPAAMAVSNELMGTVRSALAAVDLHEDWDARWAVRSSAIGEDATVASFAGMHGTWLNVEDTELRDAIAACWASLHSAHAAAYRDRRARRARPPMMAVIVQRMVRAQTGGIAFSIDPLTGNPDRLVVNAALGLGDGVAAGTVAADHIVIHRRGHGHYDVEAGIALSEANARDLAALVDRVSALEEHPVDIEWALSASGFWLLQARPAAAAHDADDRVTDATCVWSRANFKETMPEVPSPLAISYLQDFMEHSMLRHYREAGCRIDPGLSSLRLFHGRPYINVTLFQSLAAQLGGDPSVIAEHMGGTLPPMTHRFSRLSVPRLIAGGLGIQWKMWRATRRAPSWFLELRQLYERVQRLSAADDDRTWLEALEPLSARGPTEDLTFAIVSGVSASLYVLELTLNAIPDWRGLLHAATQGQGTIISAMQIARLTALAEIARQDPQVEAVLAQRRLDDPMLQPDPGGRPFQRAFASWLDEYGHRATGESDVMSPRFAEIPAAHLGIVASLLEHRRTAVPMSDATRVEALRCIRRACGWRIDRWLWFRFWHRRLCRFLALREANRHAVMYFVAAARRMLLEVGRRHVERGTLDRSDDLFFLSTEELFAFRDDPSPRWRPIIQERRAEWARHADLPAPDLLLPGQMVFDRPEMGPDSRSGLPISTGAVESVVRLVRSAADYAKVGRGDIIVAPVIDPGIAPLLALAGGVIAAMGGVLSHGAIIAREYGVPTVANVPDAMTWLKDGDRVRIDAGRGTVERLG
ncbi:MAG TPA: PEP/pyruvate-binding domain-containing protein [Nitrospirales bacterium]|nr:PEP/pyruvate-binding domain-containing protein [Nitrospirales bacterium]